MATQTDIETEITSNGWEIVQRKDTGIEGNYTHKALGSLKAVGDVITRKWFHIYVHTDGTAYWQEAYPFATSGPSFKDDLNSWLSSLISAGEIKSAFPINTDGQNEKAVVLAYVDDGSGNVVGQNYHIKKDANNNFVYEPIT